MIYPSDPQVVTSVIQRYIKYMTSIDRYAKNKIVKIQQEKNRQRRILVEKTFDNLNRGFNDMILLLKTNDLKRKMEK
jgi:hypothetical protein